MPRMDGPTAVKAMRKLGQIGMIIGLSGNALDRDLEVFRVSGVNYALTKPLDLELFNEIMVAEFKKIGTRDQPIEIDL